MLSVTPSIPKQGGSLSENSLGVAGCSRCGWKGVMPAVRRTRNGPVDAILSTFCPSCERTQLDAAVAGRKPKAEVPPGVRRNAPCPCGSGKKAKKCHYK